MNRIDKLFRTKKKNILSVYFTAGYPSGDSVEEIILLLGKNGADMIELGIPYSDPLADGPVIQESARIAINNGMTLENLFVQIKDIRKKTGIPLLLMGYINPVIQFGFSRFCKCANDAGIDGLIIPDLPMAEYEMYFRESVMNNNLKNVFLITPDTSEERIRQIDEKSTGFIYIVSSASTTGETKSFDEKNISYFERISGMKLKNPILAGFGIHNRETLEQVNRSCNGAVIGSAYMRALQVSNSIEEGTVSFFKNLKM